MIARVDDGRNSQTVHVDRLFRFKERRVFDNMVFSEEINLDSADELACEEIQILSTRARGGGFGELQEDDEAEAGVGDLWFRVNLLTAVGEGEQKEATDVRVNTDLGAFSKGEARELSTMGHHYNLREETSMGVLALNKLLDKLIACLPREERISRGVNGRGAADAKSKGELLRPASGRDLQYAMWEAR